LPARALAETASDIGSGTTKRKARDDARARIFNRILLGLRRFGRCRLLGLNLGKQGGIGLLFEIAGDAGGPDIGGFQKLARRNRAVLQELLAGFAAVERRDLVQFFSRESLGVDERCFAFQIGTASGELRDMDADLHTQVVLGMITQPAMGIVYDELDGPLAPRAAEVMQAIRKVLAP